MALRLLLAAMIFVGVGCLRPNALAISGDEDMSAVSEPLDLGASDGGADLGPKGCVTCGRPCRSDAECGTGIICLVPGESPECVRILGDGGTNGACASDSDCPAGLVCDLPACFAVMADKRCKPPCQVDTDCPVTKYCFQGHCQLGFSFCGNCPAPYFACNAQFDGYECDPQHCSQDDTCVPDGGTCIKGTCYDSPGTCTAPFGG